MTIEQLESIIVGKWQYQDGKILEFISGQKYVVISSDGKTKIPSRIFFKDQNGDKNA